MLDLQDKQGQLINEEVCSADLLTSVSDHTKAIASEMPETLAWLAAESSILPYFCKNWTSYTSDDVLSHTKDMTQLLEKGIPTALAILSTMLKNHRSACRCTKGLQAWVSSFAQWVHLRNVLQVRTCSFASVAVPYLA
jgi:hypothetical protein